jgi:hypothetical protein
MTLSELSRGELEDRILVFLAEASWQDITGADGTDPSASQSLCAGFATKLEPIWILSRYEDDEDTFTLVAGNNQMVGWNSLTQNQIKLAELWEAVSGQA